MLRCGTAGQHDIHIVHGTLPVVTVGGYDVIHECDHFLTSSANVIGAQGEPTVETPPTHTLARTAKKICVVLCRSMESSAMIHPGDSAGL